MKNIVAVSAILSLFAGASYAASAGSNERPDIAPTIVVAENVQQVAAKSIYSTKELSRADLNPNDIVEVTVFPSTGLIDAPSRAQ